MTASRAFSGQQASVPHLSKKELADLRGDVEAGFAAAEKEMMGAGVAQANLRLNVQPANTDTVTIGADVYEFVTTLGTETAGRIGVARGANAAAALANIVAAANQTASSTQAGSVKSTEKVKASVFNTDFLHIEWADRPGGTPVGGVKPNVALSEALTDTATWDQTNLNKTGYDASEAMRLRRTLHKVVVDATNLAADFRLKVDNSLGTMVKAEVLAVTSAAGVPDATGKAASIVLTLNTDHVLVDLDSGGTDPVATDIVYIELTWVVNT